ncbi:alpha/beta fold hydrolase [Blastococcus sp. PRF04-17]|uniref:alpha/beta fold hydrolase n=1 Tax=Blastococcus sp. PRF04-17 TaxID=2933797 RepID=UPI001FF3C374|nr:alpha/beta fold hydrolase [Blastococcus sp. PRF04-17]UOY02322.1 alpha/beta hydrolase [Blastococcus sp. PRF04-17]
MTADVSVLHAAGGRLAYRRSGAGPPLLLLHGGWSDGRDWLPQLDSLSDEFDVIAWDAPGCGGSDDPARPATIAGYADAVADLVLGLGLGAAHLCGLSFGGGLALAVYREHPELVRSLVLVSAYAGWRGSLPPEEVAARLQRVRAELGRPPAEWIDGYLPGFFARRVPAETLALVRSTMLDVRREGTEAMLAAFADADLRDVLPTVAVPTLVLHGSADVRAPRPVADALYRSIPGARLVVLPGVGHVINLEVPEAFDREVRDFLRTVD